MAKDDYDFSGLDPVETDEKEYDFSGIDTLDVPDKYIEDTIEEPPSMLESVGRGGLQGLTMNTSEEIGAGTLALPSWIADKMRESTEKEGLGEIQTELVGKLTTNYHQALESGDTEKADKIKLMIEKEQATPFKAEEAESIGDIYRGFRDEGREADKAAKEENPWAYGLAEVGGGILPAISTGGASAVATGVKTVGTGLVKQALKTGGKKAAEKLIAKEAAKGLAKAGSKFGAVDAFGRSEADLTKGDIVGAVQDTAIGAGVGAVGGVVLPMAGKGLIKGAESIGLDKPFKWLASKLGKKEGSFIDEMDDKIEGIELTRTFKTSASEARKGTKMVTAKGLDTDQKILEDNMVNINKTINDITKGKNNDIIKQNLSTSEKIDFVENLDPLLKKLDNSIQSSSPDIVKFYSNIKGTVLALKDRLIREAGHDPKLMTEPQLLARFNTVIDDIKLQQKAVFRDEKAVNNLISKALKSKGVKSIDTTDIQKIQEDFNIGSPSEVMDIMKDVYVQRITKVKVDPKTGEMVEYPFQLKEVMDRYLPEIIEEEGKKAIKLGPGKFKSIGGKVFQDYRPEEKITTTAKDIFSLKREISDLIYNEDSKFLKQHGMEYLDELDTIMKKGISDENLTKISGAMKNLKDLHNLDYLVPGIGKRLNEAEQAEFIEKTTKLFQKIHTLDPGESKAIRDSINNIIRKAIPEITEETLGEIQETAGRKYARSLLTKSGEIRFPGPLTTVSAHVGSLTGKTARYMNMIRNAPSNTLKYIAKPNTKLGKFLTSLAEVTDGQKKNALIFSAMQNPELRGELEETFKDLDKKEE